MQNESLKGSFVSFKKVVQIQRNNKSGNKKRGSYEAFQQLLVLFTRITCWERGLREIKGFVAQVAGGRTTVAVPTANCDTERFGL